MSLLQRAKQAATGLMANTAAYFSGTIATEITVSLLSFTARNLYYLGFVSNVARHHVENPKSEPAFDLDPLPASIFFFSSMIFTYRLLPTAIKGFWYNSIPTNAFPTDDNQIKQILADYKTATSAYTWSELTMLGISVFGLLNTAATLFFSTDLSEEERTLMKGQAIYLFLHAASELWQNSWHKNQIELKTVSAETQRIANVIHRHVNQLPNNRITSEIITESLEGFNLSLVKLTIHDRSKYKDICDYLNENFAGEQSPFHWPVIFDRSDCPSSNEIYIVPFATNVGNMDSALHETFVLSLCTLLQIQPPEPTVVADENIPPRPLPPSRRGQGSSSTLRPTARSFTGGNTLPPAANDDGIIIQNNRGCTIS